MFYFIPEIRINPFVPCLKHNDFNIEIRYSVFKSSLYKRQLHCLRIFLKAPKSHSIPPSVYFGFFVDVILFQLKHIQIRSKFDKKKSFQNNNKIFSLLRDQFTDVIYPFIAPYFDIHLRHYCLGTSDAIYFNQTIFCELQLVLTGCVW